MKKDIPIKKVTDVAMAIVPVDGELWDVFLINLKEQPIRNVLVNAKGYGERQGRRVDTTLLRYYYEAVEGLQAVKIEPIQTELFDLAHEYWVSFQFEDFLYDRKYVFVQGSISEEYFRTLPIIEQRGIMIL